MRRFISILLAVMLMASMVISVSAAGAPARSLFNLVATGGDDPEPAAEDTYVVAGKPASILGTEWNAADVNNAMTKGDDGKYSKTYTVEGEVKDVQLKVVKNGTEWIGDANNQNVTFDLTGAGSFTVTIDPANNEISVTGDIVSFPTELVYEAAYAVGNGDPDGDTYLNKISWDPGAEENKMTETSEDVWEYETKKGEFDPDKMEFKFALGSWTHSFGLGEGATYESGVETDAVYNGQNIVYETTETGTLTLKLDLSAFNFATKTGAKMTITWTPDEEPGTEAPTEEPGTEEPGTEAPTEEPGTEPATEPATEEPIVGASTYYVVGTFNSWTFDENYRLTPNPGASDMEYMINLTLTTTDQFKVKMDAENPIWYPDGMGNNYGENGEIAENGNYTIYFRPNGDGGADWFYNVIYVEKQEPSAIEQTNADDKAVKVLRDGQIYIIRDGKTYTVMGAMVK